MNFYKKFWHYIIVLSIIAILTISIIIIMIYGPEKASFIGSAIGGITAPILSLSALIMIIITYTYQKKQDDSINSKNLILKSLENLQLEMERTYILLNTSKTIFTQGIKKQISEKEKLMGKEAFDYYGYLLIKQEENGIVSQNIQDSMFFTSVSNIFEGTSLIASEIKTNKYLDKDDKKLLNFQVKLFYINNVFVESIREAHIKYIKDCKKSNKESDKNGWWFPEKIDNAIEGLNEYFNIKYTSYTI